MASITVSKLFAMIFSIGLIVALALTIAYYVGEVQIFWRRFSAHLNWARWKKSNLKIGKVK